MGSLITHNIHTVCGTVLRTSSPRIQNYPEGDGETGTGGNFRPSHAVPWHIPTAQVSFHFIYLHSSIRTGTCPLDMEFDNKLY